MPWNMNQVPPQTGRLAIVTGANIGLGFETALALAGKNCTVVLACRNMPKAEAAKAHAESEFERYRVTQDRLFESDFDRAVKATQALEQVERQLEGKGQGKKK